MERKDFITKMLDLGAEFDQSTNNTQRKMITNEAEMLVDTFVKYNHHLTADKEVIAINGYAVYLKSNH